MSWSAATVHRQAESSRRLRCSLTRPDDTRRVNAAVSECVNSCYYNASIQQCLVSLSVTVSGWV